jgi:hypothetical protein
MIGMIDEAIESIIADGGGLEEEEEEKIHTDP